LEGDLQHTVFCHCQATVWDALTYPKCNVVLNYAGDFGSDGFTGWQAVRIFFVFRSLQQHDDGAASPF
jgi:hypothetical protein